jgi:hypothetical protein
MSKLEQLAVLGLSGQLGAYRTRVRCCPHCHMPLVLSQTSQINPPRSCVECGAEMVGVNRNRKYCSPRCNKRAQRKRQKPQ